MIDHAHDLAAVFYGPDFASPFVRSRPGADDLTVMGILGAVDEEALDGRAFAAERSLAFAAGQDVRVGDHIVCTVDIGPDVLAGTTFRVLEQPKRVNDGLELEALLGSVPA
ncbi:hypothetical protein BH11PSE13_BH11PSE13_12190 [soil metagenome]